MITHPTPIKGSSRYSGILGAIDLVPSSSSTHPESYSNSTSPVMLVILPNLSTSIPPTLPPSFLKPLTLPRIVELTPTIIHPSSIDPQKSHFLTRTRSNPRDPQTPLVLPDLNPQLPKSLPSLLLKPYVHHPPLTVIHPGPVPMLPPISPQPPRFRCVLVLGPEIGVR